MSEKDNVKLVQQIYADFKAGNIQALLQKLDPKIYWELPKMENVPFGGIRQGREAIGNFFAEVEKSQEPLRFEPKEYVAQDDRVIYLGEYQWRIISNNRMFSGKFAHVFTIKNGLVVNFLEFTDTAAAERAYQKAMSA